ncbi:MAG: MobF family relaxase, partial [Acidimicrobiales bacterium]
MSLTLMAPSAWSYYAEEVATGREDYYALGAEHPGRFVGRGAELLGIEGEEVSALAMERLFGYGQDPRDGSPLGRCFSPKDERAVAGFALTFSPPKTVSVLWALGDETSAAAVSSSHDKAVDAAMRFLDDHASFTRRGHNGVHQVDTDGFLAARFVHRTSRAADPQLHTHVLVANKARAEDGAWLSLDGRELFETQKAAGMLYKAALRAELMSRAGVRWTAVDDNGVAEIEGVPQLLVEYWSERRKQLKAAGDELIAERSAELGRSLTQAEQVKCYQIAAYQTRTPKVDADTPTAELRERWAEEARSWGLEPKRWLKSVLRKAREIESVASESLVTMVVARLEDRSATFGRAGVVEEASRLLTGADAESTRQLVEELTDVVLGERDVLSLAGPLPVLPLGTRRRGDGMTTIERHGAVRFTTGRILRQEAAILDLVAEGRETRASVVSLPVVDSILEQSDLGEDQQAAVRGLLTGGEQVALLVGPAGAGKSRALDVAREAWT